VVHSLEVLGSLACCKEIRRFGQADAERMQARPGGKGRLLLYKS
jgi:hypothetical protein